MSVIYFLLVIAGVTIGLVLRSYLPAYFGEKGKNLATREDIEEITGKIESIKHDFATALEKSKHEHSLRLAAIDTRLKAHQDAYVLWWKLRAVIYNQKEIGKVLGGCEDWWVHNNLYLGHDVREAFWGACKAAGVHQSLTLMEPRTPESAVLTRSNWETFDKARVEIENAVDLPNFALPEPTNPNLPASI
jgi:hypothetical protein